MTRLDLEGLYPDSWACVDCGVNTAPGLPIRAEVANAYAAGALKVEPGVTFHITDQCEIYTVRDSVWKAAGMAPKGGCLCIGCLEVRLGRMLVSADFTSAPINDPSLWDTPGIRQRKGKGVKGRQEQTSGTARFRTRRFYGLGND